MMNYIKKIVGNIRNNLWIKAAGIRAIKTMSQTAISLIGTNAYLHEISFSTIFSASIVSGTLSVLTSLAGLPEVYGE